LLIAIIVPILREAREQENTVVCLSNLKQIGAAVIMYANDNDDYLPDTNAGGGGPTIWRNIGRKVGLGILIPDYLPLDIFYCSTSRVKLIHLNLPEQDLSSSPFGKPAWGEST